MRAFITKNRQQAVVWAILGLILLVGGAFRFQALSWDQGQYFHPDERAIVQAVLNLNEVPTTGAADSPRQEVAFPPGGLGFFLPNSKSNLRPATDLETQAYRTAQKQGQTYPLPSNVVPPDQSVPAEAVNLWNASYSPINPHFFAYGSLPMYLMKLGGHLASIFTGQNWADWEHITLVGRFLSGMWSMGTLVLVFLLGRLTFRPTLGRARSDAIGLLAAGFLAVTVLDIQLAHFATSDVTLTFFVMLALYWGVRLARSGGRRAAIGLGIAVGLALSSKVSAAPVVLAAGVAALLYGLYGPARLSGERAFRPTLGPVTEREHERYGDNGAALGPRLLSGTLLNLVIAGLAALVAWFVAMPYAFIDFASWSSRVIEETGMSRGINDLPYTRQYIGSIPFLYQTQNMVQWELSWPLGLLALAGLAFSLWRAVRLRLKAELVLLSFLVPYVLITFTGEVKFDRYSLPIIPILLILAARLVVGLGFHHRDTKTGRNTEGVGDQGSGVGDQGSGIRGQGSVGSGKQSTILHQSTIYNLQSTIPLTVGGLALVWAFVWALSFSHIYSERHTMNQSATWMAQNIPNGNTVSQESFWEEGSRVSIEAHNWCDPEVLSQQGICQAVMFDMYPDAPNDEKIDYLVGQLKKTDYYVINSNRLYATMPKLPWRYPVQIQFYDLLFSGKLGFQQVASFTDYPTVPLVGWQVNDDSADESFTVYDHPKVLIFKKTQKLADDELRGLFAPTLTAPAIAKRKVGPNDLPAKLAGQGDGVLTGPTASQYKTVDCSQTPTNVGINGQPNANCPSARSLLLDQPVDQLPVVDDMGWNGLANDNQWLAVILWFLLIQGLGLIALPISWRVLRRLPDRGYILAKPMGAVIVALVIWLMVWTRLVMNTALTAWVALALTAGFGGWLWWRYRAELPGWLARHRRLILVEEGLFVGVYLVWVLFRVGNPDLWHPYFGGEKPMEMTQLLGILKSPYFPPYDPWFSDGYINYYYYGQYLVATWIKLSGISPFIAFNLAVPIIYAFTCTAAFSLIFNLSLRYKQHRARLDPAIDPTRWRGPALAGLFGVVIFAVGGNMDALLQLLQRSPAITDLANKLQIYPDPVKPLQAFDYFRSSRIIPGTINEFPAFSFVYSDLHAHLVALPYTLIAMALAFNLIATDWQDHQERRADGRRSVWQMTGGRLWQVFDHTLLMPIILMIVIGFLYATNSWDLPTYLLLVGAAVFMALFRRYFGMGSLHHRDTEIGRNTEGDRGSGIGDRGSEGVEPQSTIYNLQSTIEGDQGSEEVEPQSTIYNLQSTIPKQSTISLPSVALDLLLTGVVMVGTLAGGLALYWNFFSHFQAFYSSIGVLQDRLDTASYQDVRTISGRTEFKYFLVIFLLPLFVILSYLFWNGLDWLRAGRSARPPLDSGDWADYDDFEGVEEDAEEWDEQPQAVQPTLPGFGLRRLLQPTPQLAFLTAGVGADGGSNGGFGSGGGLGGPGGGAERPAFNSFARAWLVGLAAFGVFVTVVGLVAPNNWLVFMLSLAIMVGCVVLIFARAFDRRHPDQPFEATDPSSIFLKLMLLAGFGVTAATEVIYLKDDMGGDGTGEYARMNTIFKFQYQVWALLTLAAAFAAYVIWTRWIAGRIVSPRRLAFAMARRFSWIGVLMVLVFSALLYPAQAIPARVTERGSSPIPAPTLDGRAYFKTLHAAGGVPGFVPGLSFDLTLDAQSVFEFYDKVKGTPVVLEASIYPYRGGGSFIPINTGLPTVLGWDHHERQQRYPNQVDRRSGSQGGQVGDIRAVYNTTSAQEALELLNHYHVTYVHVGVIEREAQYYFKDEETKQETITPYMSEDGYAKFEQMVKLGLLEVAYQNPGVTIFRVTPRGQSGVITGTITGGTGNVTLTDPKQTRLEGAVKADPNSWQAHYNLGEYYYTKKQYDKAAAELETVVKLEPNKVNPYHVLGDIYRDNGDSNRALAAYKRATEVTGLPLEMPAAFNKYGVALQALQRYDEAITQFQAVLKLDPHFTEAYFHQAEVFEAQGKKDQAIAAYQQTVANSQKKDDFWTQRATIKIRELAAK